MFEYDKRYQTFEKNLRKDFPELTGYEIVNFYKIHLLYELAKEYDEILYLDFDAVPLTKDPFLMYGIYQKVYVFVTILTN